MFSYEKILLNLSKQLYPTGRAFRTITKSFKEKLHNALNKSINRTYNDGLSVLDSLYPDNENYTEEDATNHEERFGLLVTPGTSFEDRKLAILRKMAHPGIIKARQHYLYIQSQLQKAGFNVFIHENRFKEGLVWVAKSPQEFFPGAGLEIQYGDDQYGDSEYGERIYDTVVNHIQPERDKNFTYQDPAETFFICGENLGDLANIPAIRRNEFRQLILKLKPAHLVGLIFVNYT